jgi:CheY-like chemotaxis protein/HPt (histidine-containing phosphotransfer) domain-containing protein
VRGDPSRLRQVLTNLIDNAIKFTERGDVLVRVSQESQTESHVQIRVAVTDTGVGLSAEAQRHLFLPFYQAEETTGRRQSGTGLGLAICKQIIEQMGGRIGAESALGKGSTFWFTVPLQKQSPSGRAPAAGGDLAYLKLLVIDANEASRHALQYETASWGMRTDAVSSGVEGLEQLRRQAASGDPYEAVLVDTNLADMDALGIGRAVKNDVALAGTKVVLMTTMNQRFDPPTLQAAGIEASLVKPIRHSQLYDCLARLFSERHRQAATGEPAPADTQAPATPALANAAATLRILLAEDNVINQKVAVGLLEKLHCRCDVVENGRQVLQALERTPYDVILMDCQIPLLDGYRTTMEIRRREAEKKPDRPARAYIIAITAHAMRGAREKCLAAGMDDYISKPVRLAELEAALQRAVDFLNRSAAPNVKPETTTPVDHTALAAVRELRRADRPDPLTELITAFLRDTPSRLRDIREALGRHDLPTAELLAKQLSADAGHLGAQKIAALSSQLAAVAREGASALASALAAEMEIEFQSVRAALEADKAR